MDFALTPQQADGLPAARAIVVLAPHGDDAVFGCGGTLALHAQAQTPITTVVLTHGNGRTEAKWLQREGERAAKLLGLTTMVNWGVPNRELYATEILRTQLVRLLESLDADLLYAPSLWEAHPDHRQTALLAQAAVRHCRHPVRLAHYEIAQPLRPNTLVDITPVAGLKQQAMRCFSSQLGMQDQDLQIDALNRYRTFTLARSVKAAEAFVLLTPAEVLANMPTGPHGEPQGSSVTATTAQQATRPKVTVLIRSADRPFLHQALDSVALQTHGSVEVLIQAVVPDHSPVPSRCGPYPISLLRTTRPLSRSEAANALLDAASGPWLVFLDDDDWLMPSHLARMADTLAHQHTARAAYTGVVLVDVQNTPIGTSFDIPYDPARWPAGNLTPIHAVMFHRDMVSQGCRFDLSLDRYEDWDFWLQLNRHTTFLHLPGISAAYRIHDSSGVHTDSGPGSDASAVIHEKWSAHWNSSERRGLMERAWAFADLEQKLLETQRNLDALKTIQETERAHFEHQLAEAQSQRRKELTLREQQLLESQVLREKERSMLEGQLAEARALASRRHLPGPSLKTHPLHRVWASAREAFARLRQLPLRYVPHKLGRAVEILRNEGPQSLLHRLSPQPDWVNPSAIPYTEWVMRFDTHDTDTLTAQRQRSMQATGPLLSVVMPVYNPPIDLLEQAVASVQEQTYPCWELCIADDASTDPEVWPRLQALADKDSRIHLVHRAENGHISHASNSALALAQGDFIVLMDNDDLLPPDALYWVVDAITRHPQAKVLYSDEDKLGPDGQRFGAYMKSAWNHTLFLGHNMISHLGIYDRKLVEDVGGFRPGYEGSQDYDLALRCVARIRPDQVVHIPRVLYHWRVLPGSTALGAEEKPYALTSAHKALQEHLDDAMPGARVEVTPAWNYRVMPPAVDPAVQLTVVVISAHGWFINHERLRQGLQAVRCRQLVWSEPDLASLHRILAECQTPLVAFLEEGLTPLSTDAVDEMCAHAMRPGVAAVTGAVFNPQDRLIDGAWIVSPDTGARVLHHNLPLQHPGYMGRAQLAQEISAMGFGCVVFQRTTMLDHNLPASGSLTPSVVLAWCSRVRAAGQLLVWTPCARWRSKSWGEPKGIACPPGELAGAATAFVTCDLAYHPCLDADCADFSLSNPQGDRPPRSGGASSLHFV